MSTKKVTPHQMRKGLTYVAQGPDFMRMLTGQSANAANNDPRNPYRKPVGIEAKFQTEQDDDDDDETAHDLLNEREEERPTVVVLKDSKHLDERQVRNILKNLPPGLSDAEIQKRLAEETEKLDSSERQGEAEEEAEEDEEDQDPVDANGKILFRKPKGSKSRSKNEPLTLSSSKKSFEETVLSGMDEKASTLKRKSDSTSASDGKKKEDSGGASGTAKKKKQKTAKATLLLSFDDNE
ncbi:hypothetical protein EDD11_008023 [Mortierella claussenii]|nr:hypothetical protein EDD11_008023 [Mortierella claussenii]